MPHAPPDQPNVPYVADPAADGTVPAEFGAAVAAMRAVQAREELQLTEIPAPGRVAPYSASFAADVRPSAHAVDSVLGTGRFILLHDPEAPEAWGDVFRVVAYAQAPLESDIGVDPFVADVAWSWLVDALEQRGAEYTAASGTATKQLSTGYGELAGQADGAQLELRASWTPADRGFAAHLEAWTDLLCMLAGLPPAADGVSLLSLRRATRG
jgi:hypothetical protein